ncbi:MAG: hypothetical protein JSW72_01065, partial [Candidatus Bathyarchaeota archaeon]
GDLVSVYYTSLIKSECRVDLAAFLFLFAEFLLHLPLNKRLFPFYLGERMSPQLRCPQCGTSINLHSRKKLDLHMIVSELKKGPKTFTDLLHATRLPRKTLSLRLIELRQSGIIIKEKEYRLNGSPPPSYSRGELEKLFAFDNKRKILLLALIMCISIPVGTYAFASYVAPPPPAPPPEPPAPQYYGLLVVDLRIQDVVNLYSWQARIRYDAQLLEFRNFTKTDGSLFSSSLMDIFGLNSTDTFVLKDQHLSDDLLVADSLQGDVPAVDGSGTLGRITFAVKTPEKTLEFFQEAGNAPSIVFEPTIVPAFTTFLQDADGQEISNAESLLDLEVAELIS